LGGVSLACAAAWEVTDLELSTVLNDYHGPRGAAYSMTRSRRLWLA